MIFVVVIEGILEISGFLIDIGVFVVGIIDMGVGEDVFVFEFEEVVVF